MRTRNKVYKSTPTATATNTNDAISTFDIGSRSNIRELLRKEQQKLEKYQQKSKKPDENASKWNERARKSQEKLRFFHEEIRKNVTVMIISYYHLDIVCRTNQVSVFILLDMKIKQKRRALPSVDHAPVGDSEDVKDDDDDQDSTVNSIDLTRRRLRSLKAVIRSLLFSKKQL
jgi:hypothetical protein